MSYSAIDPDGVLAMSAATAALAGTLAQDGQSLQGQIDAVSHLVGGAPDVRQRTDAVAGDLTELAGWARSVALRYVDDIKPLRELASLGFWLPDFSKLGWDADNTVLENLDKTARSDEFGAFALGVSQALLERYRRWQLHVPRPGAPLPPGSLRLPPPDDVVGGRPVVRRASGLLVPHGSSADPGIRRLGTGPSWYQPGQRGMVTDPSYGRPPPWARVGGKALGVAGVGLTLYDSYMNQWEQDAQYHPEWSTGQRVASAGYNMATEGGGAVALGLLGAKLGAAAGSFVPIPVVGTVGGALVGGAIGAFVGSKAGKALGRGLKEGTEALVDGAEDVWDSVFG